LVLSGWLNTGEWGLPGGGLHKNEPTVDGLLREVREETGLDVEVSAWQRRVHHQYTHGSLCLTFFLCFPLDETDPIPPFDWVAREELGRLRFPEANSSVIKDLILRKDMQEEK